MTSTSQAKLRQTISTWLLSLLVFGWDEEPIFVPSQFALTFTLLRQFPDPEGFY
jgi:hypothetical protein